MIYLEAFLQSKRSERTRIHYRSILYSYLDYCKLNSLELMNADSVVSYIHSLKVAASTIDNRIGCLKSYFSYLEECDIKPVVKLKHRFPRSNKDNVKQTNGLSDSEAIKILKCIKEPMHLALFNLMLFTGIRISEVQGLMIDDFKEHNNGHTITVLGKGGKYRTLPLQKEIAGYLKDYLNTRASIREGQNSPLFSLDGINPIHKNTIRMWLKKYCKEVGVKKKISPHSLRVTCVTNALEQNCNPVYVMHLGGWTTMEMVTRYDRNRQNLKNSPALKIKYAR